MSWESNYASSPEPEKAVLEDRPEYCTECGSPMTDGKQATPHIAEDETFITCSADIMHVAWEKFE